MGALEFDHIHCSSRFDRSAATLETDLDTWMAQCDLITVTEVTNDQRASRLAEKGWSYFNSKANNDSDNCAIAWDNHQWRRQAAVIRRLENTTYARLNGLSGLYIYSCSVVLKQVGTGKRLLVTLCHFPAHVEGANGFRTDVDQWAARKIAYLSALNTWATHIKDLERKHHADATMIVADWNLNLKDDWVHKLLRDKFGDQYKFAWNQLPTSGGNLPGGAQAPPGAPGGSSGDRIIDGTLYRHLEITKIPDLMARVASSDHRPYRESFRFLGKAEKPSAPVQPTGDVKYGPAWWGFGDYADDEIYAITRVRD